MNIATIIAVIALVLVVFFAVRYIYKQKKSVRYCLCWAYSGERCKQNSGGSWH